MFFPYWISFLWLLLPSARRIRFALLTFVLHVCSFLGFGLLLAFPVSFGLRFWNISLAFVFFLTGDSIRFPFVWSSPLFFLSSCTVLPSFLFLSVLIVLAFLVFFVLFSICSSSLLGFFVYTSALPFLTGCFYRLLSS